MVFTRSNHQGPDPTRGHRPARLRSRRQQRQTLVRENFGVPSEEDSAEELEILWKSIPASGDPWMPAKDRVFRVVHFNKHGINLDVDGDGVEQEMTFLMENQVGCWGMTEPNLNLSQKWTSTAVADSQMEQL